MLHALRKQQHPRELCPTGTHLNIFMSMSFDVSWIERFMRTSSLIASSSNSRCASLIWSTCSSEGLSPISLQGGGEGEEEGRVVRREALQHNAQTG